MPQAIEQRLTKLAEGQRRLDEGQLEIIRRLEVAERERGAIRDTLRDVVVELGGVPDELGRDPQRRSIRRRLHELENDKSAAEAATAAVAAASKLHDAAAEHRFSRREKLAALFFAGVVALGPYLAPLVYHHPG